MFTPPSSPQPPRNRSSCVNLVPDELLVPPESSPASVIVPLSPKHKVAHHLRWSVILVPLTLILIVATTRFLSHPAAFDLLIPGAQRERRTWTENIMDWSPHMAHAQAHPPPTHAGHVLPLLRRSATPTVAPTVPQNPVLPTPFPQPFDTTLSTNFSTTQCYNFFLNMTQTTPFRSCRPFSLLLTHSHEFQEAQNNITAMNIDIWGTCNTVLPWNQCNANMAWFASALQSSCVTDLGDRNAMAMDTLVALQAFNLMRNASCQVDPDTNTYCYVESVADPDPSSYWFYLLPLGETLVKITSNACNQCTKGLMAMYADALSSSTPLSGLQQTYENAAKSLNNACGSNFATASVSSAAPAQARLPRVGLLLVWILFGSWHFSVM
ncbi:hypothetical protein V8B97DRAFT_1874238 [Scleroderma yunnanense]